MVLRAVVDVHEVKTCKEVFEKPFQEGAEIFRCPVGWRKAYGTVDVYWKKQGLWTVVEESQDGHWFAFGLDRPVDGIKLHAICEVNLQSKTGKMRTAGVYAKDDEGHCYIAHSGVFGGSKGRIKRNDFLGAQHENVAVVEYSGENSREVVLIGRVDDPSIVDHVIRFVDAVKSCKDGAK